MKKHNLRGWTLFVLVLVFAAGCGANRPVYQSAPGNVLGLEGNAASQKVVAFSVIGKGLEPEHALTKGEAKLMAERAAIADGYRQMVEKIRGVYVDAFTKAGFGRIDQDLVATKTQSWLRGVEVVEIKEAQYGITEAHMQLNVYFAKKDMVWWPVGIGPNVRPVQDAGIVRAEN